MKKLILFLMVCFLLTGCGSYTSKNAEKDLTKQIENLKSYSLSGELEIVNNSENYKYDVSVDYKKTDKFRVSLKNQTNNHEQIILKNDDGVYVVTHKSTKQKLNIIFK